ncbi:hypothetical protein O0L34_g18090 [Tuta absoluta]|nr:hypothetical protein O0L34_g18090 [Tuta absoluta]
MPNSRIPSPARSQGPPVTPRRYKKRGTRSVGSPARSSTSGRLSNIVDQFKENNRESFAASPLSKTVLSDNTEIEMPRRQSWWRKVNNSRDVTEVLANERLSNPANVLDEFEVEVLTQEKKNYSMDLPESSDNESIHSIVVQQRRLFTIKENVPQQKFGDVVATSKENKTQTEDKTIHVATKNLFSKTSQRPKPVFPSALLNITAEKTLENKTKEAIELPEEIKTRPKSLFDRPSNKRKNYFPDLVVSEGEDSIPEIIPKRFTFHKPSDPSRRSSNASSVTTDIDMDDWKLLPSSTMVEHQLEAQLTTPGKRARLSKLSEGKESTNPDFTKQTNKSVSSKNKSKLTPAKDVDTEKLPATSPSKDVDQTTTQKHNTSQNKSRTFNKTKNVSQTQDIVTIANEEAKEASQVKNKTYNVNQTIDKHISKNQKDYQENIENVQNADKTELTQMQNTSQNKSKTFNKTKNLSQAQDIGINVGANDASQVKNKTYNVNQTIDKQISKNQKDHQEYIENEVADKTELTHMQNVSQNKSKTFNKTKNMSQTHDLPPVANEHAQETSQVRNKTYNINQTIKNLLHKSQDEHIEDVQRTDKIEQKDMEIVETEELHDDDEDIALTYEDNDPEEIQENNDKEIHEIDNKTKTICADNRLSKVSEYMDNIEIELSKIVGDEQNHAVLQMETPMPNKSVHLTKRVVEETPEPKFQGRQSRNVETFNKSSDKSQMIGQKQLENANEHNESTITQEPMAKSHEQTANPENILQQAQESNQEGEALVHNVEEKEASDDEIEASDQDQAEASQVIEDSDQEGTDAEQELEVDEEDQEPSQQEDEEICEQEESENDELEISQEVDNDEIDDEEQNASQEVEENQEDEQSDDQDAEIDDEVLNESQNNEEDHNESEEIVEEQNESQELEEEQIESEEEEQNESEEVVEEDEEEEQISQEIVDNDEQNESQEPEEEVDEEDQDMEDVIEASEEMEEDGTNSHEPQQSTSKIEVNVSHDTTGRNRKRATNTPEAILHDATNEIDSSIIAKGRNTSIRKTLLKNFTIRPSMAPARESTRLSDGTKNSSAEGSGWDSHRTTRKTLRQTFGKDFTPRKSLRALVMEKSAKRQTQINEANELLRHQANSTEIPDDQDHMDYEENVAESDHEVSRRTKQTTLEAYLMKIKEENMEFNKKIEQQVRDSIKSNPRMNWNFQPNKPTIQRMKPKVTAPKIQRQKRSVINIENLPPELLEDMKYRPPKRFRPANASWITKRLYKFLETKLEPKYDYKARVRAEKLVETIYNFVRDSKRLRTAAPHAIAELKREMARLDIIRTHFEFYNFFHEYLPREVIIKVVPDIANDMPVPTDIFANIIV